MSNKQTNVTTRLCEPQTDPQAVSFTRRPPHVVPGDVVSYLPDTSAEHDGFSPECYDDIEEIAEDNFWFRARNRLLVWALRTYFPSARSFLEIGCGGGVVLHEMALHFPGLSLAGGEVQARGLALARRRLPNVKLFQMDARYVPFEDEFDVVGAFDVLEHINEDEAALEQMHKAAAPGGGILLTVPQHEFLWGPIDDYSAHKRRYTHMGLVKKVERTGFKVVRATSFVSFLLPAMFVSRMKGRLFRYPTDPAAELKIPPLLNQLFLKIMSVERWCIQAGLSFPAGGSLLLVARKGLK